MPILGSWFHEPAHGFADTPTFPPACMTPVPRLPVTVPTRVDAVRYLSILGYYGIGQSIDQCFKLIVGEADLGRGRPGASPGKSPLTEAGVEIGPFARSASGNG